MENEIKKYLDKNYPLNYSVMDKEEVQENYQTKLERIAFRDGVEWALKQVKNNSVLDGVIKRFEVGMEVIWKGKPFYVVEEKDVAILVSNGLELDDDLYCDWWVNKSEVNVL